MMSQSVTLRVLR